MRLRTVGALLAAGAVTFALSGCFANPLEQLAQGGTEKFVEEQIEQATGEDVDLNLDGGDAEMPKDFPEGVPVPQGNPSFSLSLGDGWQLMYELDDPAAGEALIEQFRSSGEYTSSGSVDSGGELVIESFQSDQFSVQLSLTKESEGTAQLFYVVTKVAAE